MTDQLAPAYGWYPLVAERARNAPRDSGPCPVCQRLLARGQRVCDLANGGATVHTACADKAEVVSPAVVTASNYGPGEARRHNRAPHTRTARDEAEQRNEQRSDLHRRLICRDCDRDDLVPSDAAVAIIS